MLDLQQSAGNKAVAQMLAGARPRSIQRDSGTPVTIQRDLESAITTVFGRDLTQNDYESIAVAIKGATESGGRRASNSTPTTDGNAGKASGEYVSKGSSLSSGGYKSTAEKRKLQIIEMKKDRNEPLSKDEQALWDKEQKSPEDAAVDKELEEWNASKKVDVDRLEMKLAKDPSYEMNKYEKEAYDATVKKRAEDKELKKFKDARAQAEKDQDDADKQADLRQQQEADYARRDPAGSAKLKAMGKPKTREDSLKQLLLGRKF